MRRIRRVSVAPTKGGLFENAFVFDETESEMEVLLADDEHFEVLTFDKDSLVSTCGKYQIPHIEL
jgi:hypothetical protein